MTPNANASLLLVLGSVALSLVLVLIPLPASLAMGRPALYAATVVFWSLMQPGRFGVLTAWCAGLVLDVAYGTPLGQHALALALATFVANKCKDFLVDYPLIQQALVLLPIFGLYEFMLFWIDGVNGHDVDPLWRWLPALTTALAWPLWVLILERFTAAEAQG